MALSSFKHLNEIVSVGNLDSRQNPNDKLTSCTNQPLDPGVVLLLPWSDASLRNIEKYTTLYAQMFPEATIIVVRTGIKDFFWRSKRSSRSLIEPVVKLLGGTTDEELLVQVMSNAGAKQWCIIDEALHQSLGRRLSSSRTIIDSAPGRSHFQQTWAALRGSLPRPFIPRLLLGAVLGFVLCMLHLQKAISSSPDLLEVIRARMNDPHGVEGSRQRCYIYSMSDGVVGFADIEDHAREAEKGWQVQLVRFEHSVHVGHYKQDPARYKTAITNLWYDGRSARPPVVKSSS